MIAITLICIGIIIALGIIAFFGSKIIAWVLLCGFWQSVVAYLVAMLLVEIILLVVYKKKTNYRLSLAKKVKLSRLMRREDKEYQEQMAQYNRDMEEYDRAMAKFKEGEKQERELNMQKLSEKMPALQENLRLAEERYRNAQLAYTQDDSLANSDKTWEIINFVIDKLERKRANTITEALNQYDAMLDANAREAAQIKREEERFKKQQDDLVFMNRMRAIDEENRRREALQESQRQFERDLQIQHELNELKNKLN